MHHTGCALTGPYTDPTSVENQWRWMNNLLEPFRKEFEELEIQGLLLGGVSLGDGSCCFLCWRTRLIYRAHGPAHARLPYLSHRFRGATWTYFVCTRCIWVQFEPKLIATTMHSTAERSDAARKTHGNSNTPWSTNSRLQMHMRGLSITKTNKTTSCALQLRERNMATHRAV